jgi:hypothetical protein
MSTAELLDVCTVEPRNEEFGGIHRLLQYE